GCPRDGVRRDRRGRPARPPGRPPAARGGPPNGVPAANTLRGVGKSRDFDATLKALPRYSVGPTSQAGGCPGAPVHLVRMPRLAPMVAGNNAAGRIVWNRAAPRGVEPPKSHSRCHLGAQCPPSFVVRTVTTR